MDTAVILAAGIGRRLSKGVTQKPKGFLEVGGRPIIERSLTQLNRVGISKIVIGTGYMSELYEKLSEKLSVKCVRNYRYADTGSFFTLCNLENYIHEDFLLLESDILYEDRALESLVNHHKKDVILASGKTGSGDEVYIEVKKANYLKNLSKDINCLGSVYGELVGISRISIATIKRLFEWAGKNTDIAKKIHYEEALANVSENRDIYVEKIEDLIWTEIDTEKQFYRALDFIYPKLWRVEDA